MSWNKNTILSELDFLINVLNTFEVEYQLITLGYVIGRGLNDFGDIKYPIRKCITKDKVFIEQMIRTCDCDTDDYIKLYVYDPYHVPLNMEIEKDICVCGKCNAGFA